MLARVLNRNPATRTLLLTCSRTAFAKRAENVRKFSTETDPNQKLMRTLTGIAAGGVVLVASVSAFNSWREQKNKPMEAIEVESEEEAARMRKERLSLGIYEACLGAVQWGVISGILVYGLRALEPKMLGTDRLIKAGHPRMFFFITACMSAGFAIRGESKLIDDARIPYHVKESKTSSQ
mmetsp:Transcript_9415/g.21423  ORF Transcript_9415/g.21423 Transcript_9415/m.21423 type:complete len:180 (+) Transcript_9415:31-570(+)